VNSETRETPQILISREASSSLCPSRWPWQLGPTGCGRVCATRNVQNTTSKLWDWLPKLPDLIQVEVW